MKQGGFLYKISPTDYITGASPIQWEILIPTADWRNFLPSDEKQHNFTFDTMSCTTFSALNAVETIVNFLINNDKLTVAQLEEINKLGFIENGKFNCSDRFTAIMSGTTKLGNYFQNVIDSIRKDGLLPEKDLPFIGTTWEEYHDKSKITQGMKDKARKILDILNFAYEWVPVSQTSQEIFDSLKQSPLQVAVTKEYPTHAIMLPKIDWEFETYVPFLRPRNRTVAYAMKIQVSVNKKVKYNYFSQKEVDTYKLVPQLWELLDKMRELSKTPFRITSGLRTKEQNKKAGGKENSAHLRGLAVDLQCSDNFIRGKMLTGILPFKDQIFLEIAKRHLHIDIDSNIHKMGQVMIEPNDD